MAARSGGYESKQLMGHDVHPKTEPDEPLDLRRGEIDQIDPDMLGRTGEWIRKPRSGGEGEYEARLAQSPDDFVEHTKALFIHCMGDVPRKRVRPIFAKALHHAPEGLAQSRVGVSRWRGHVCAQNREN